MAGIPGVTLAKRCGRSRSYVSDVERGHVILEPEEFERISLALDELIRERAATLLGVVGPAQ